MTFIVILLIALVASVACLGFMTIAAVLVPSPQVIRDDSPPRL